MMHHHHDDVLATGFNIHQVVHLWLHFHQKLKLKMVFASPKGGQSPIDPRSLKEAQRDEAVAHLLTDRYLNDIFRHTQCLDHIRPEEYALALVPGSHGALLDLAKNERVAQVLHAIYYAQGKGIIATIGHGAAALLQMKQKSTMKEQGNHNVFMVDNRNGDHGDRDKMLFLEDRHVTAYTNEEEAATIGLHLDKLLPFLLENKLKEHGAKFHFETCVVVHERLVTAQNTQSIADWIQKITLVFQKNGREEEEEDIIHDLSY